MDNVPQLSALSHPQEPPHLGPQLSEGAAAKGHHGNEKRRGATQPQVPCGLAAP